MSEALGVVLAAAGMAALALAMDRHHRQVFGHAPPGRASLVLRLLGTAAIAASLVACLFAAGPSVGPVLWLGELTVAAIVVALALTFWPRFGGMATAKRRRL